MADPLNKELPTRVIYIVQDCDYILPIRRTDDSGLEPLDWDDGVEVYAWVDVSRTEKTRVDGVIDGALASIRFESTLLDTLRSGATWRAVMSQPSYPESFETPLMVGHFDRVRGARS